jgi:hypothetical protein
MRALDLQFAVRSTDPTVGVTIAQLFGALIDAAPGPVTCAYSVVGGEPGATGFTVYAGQQVVGQTATTNGVISLLLWDLNRRAVASSSRFLPVHAAAVSFAGKAVLVPGPSGTGKTTLAAGLVKSGCTYLTDEVVAIERSTGEVVPYMKPLAIKEGSRAALSAVGIECVSRLDEESEPWYVEPDQQAAVAVARRCPPGFIVLLRYSEGAPTTVASLPRSAALVALAQSSFQTLHPGSRGLELLAKVARRCRCLELRSGDLAAACHRLLESMQRPPADHA